MANFQSSKRQGHAPTVQSGQIESTHGLIRLVCLALLGMALFSVQVQGAKSADTADTDYAKELWSALQAGDMINQANAEIQAARADSPHGPLSQSSKAKVTVKGHTGQVAVHAELGDEETTTADASADPAKHLKAVNVMFKREAGFNPATNDWFWAKYNPDGTPAKDEKGAIQVGKVVDPCTACHAQQKGDDYLFHKTK